MAEENSNSNEKGLSYDWHKLAYAHVAEEYLKQGEQGIPFAKKSLEVLLEDINRSDPWIVNMVKKPNVIPEAIQSQLETYVKYKKEETVGDFLNHYRTTLENYLGEKVSEVDKDLGPFKDKKYGEIVLEIEKANHTIKGYELKKNSKEEKESAEKVIEKYDKLMTTMEMLEMKYLSDFRAKVEERMVKDTLNKIYTPKKEQEGESGE